MALGNKLNAQQLQYLHHMMMNHAKGLHEYKKKIEVARNADKEMGVIDPNREETDKAFDGMNEEIQLATSLQFWAYEELKKMGFKIVKNK